MKSKLHTNLIGRLVTTTKAEEQDRTVTGPRSTVVFKIAAIWLSDADSEPSVALTAVDKFGHDKAGPIVIDFLSNLVTV